MAEEDLVIDDDEDIGELLERASREKNRPINTILASTPEPMDITTDPAKLDHDAVSPEPLTAMPIKLFTPIAPSETEARKSSKGKLHAHIVFFIREYAVVAPKLLTQHHKLLLIQGRIVLLLFQVFF